MKRDRLRVNEIYANTFQIETAPLRFFFWVIQGAGGFCDTDLDLMGACLSSKYLTVLFV